MKYLKPPLKYTPDGHTALTHGPRYVQSTHLRKDSKPLAVHIVKYAVRSVINNETVTRVWMMCHANPRVVRQNPVEGKQGSFMFDDTEQEICKLCTKNVSRVRVLKLHTDIPEGHIYCTGCEKPLRATRFYAGASNGSRCRTCSRLYERKRRNTQPKKTKAEIKQQRFAYMYKSPWTKERIRRSLKIKDTSSPESEDPQS